MSNLDYKAMNTLELKAYVLQHHEDIEAIRELFDRSPKKVYPMPKNDEETKKIFEDYFSTRQNQPKD